MKVEKMKHFNVLFKLLLSLVYVLLLHACTFVCVCQICKIYTYLYDTYFHYKTIYICDFLCFL